MRAGPSKRQGREGVVTREKAGEELRLKTGGKIDAGIGRALYAALDNLMARSPKLLQSLVALAQNAQADIPERHAEELKACAFLRMDDGTLAPEMRMILLSAYKDTLDGPALVNPFVFVSEAEAAREDEAQKETLSRMLNTILDDDNGPPGSGRPRGR